MGARGGGSPELLHHIQAIMKWQSLFGFNAFEMPILCAALYRPQSFQGSIRLTAQLIRHFLRNTQLNARAAYGGVEELYWPGTWNENRIMDGINLYFVNYCNLITEWKKLSMHF